MNFVKRVCIFLIMFWCAGFLLTLVVQFVAGSLFNIDFRNIGNGQRIELAAAERINVYVAAAGLDPDVEALSPQLVIVGSRPETLEVTPFSFRMSPPEPGEEPVFARALNSIVAKEAQTVDIRWSNPREPYFLATSKSLLFSTVAFAAMIFLAVLGAGGLYYAFGDRVFRRLFGPKEKYAE